MCVHGRPEPASCLHVMAHFHHQRAPSPAQSGTQRCEAACLLGVPEPGSPSALADELLHAAHVQGVGRRLGGSKPASDSLRKARSPHPCPGRVASRGGADTAPPSLVLLTPSSQPGWCPRKWRGEGSRRHMGRSARHFGGVPLRPPPRSLLCRWGHFVCKMWSPRQRHLRAGQGRAVLGPGVVGVTPPRTAETSTCLAQGVAPTVPCPHSETRP